MTMHTARTHSLITRRAMLQHALLGGAGIAFLDHCGLRAWAAEAPAPRPAPAAEPGPQPCRGPTGGIAALRPP